MASSSSSDPAVGRAPSSYPLPAVAETGDVFVDCSDAGVAFVEAEGEIDARQLAGDEEHDIPAFLSLVPELDALVLPVPVLSVQATRLGTGLAVGLSVHQAVANGRAVGGSWRPGCPPPARVARSPRPVAHPNGDELGREMLQTVAPNLPAVRGEHDFSQRFLRARRTLYLGTNDIKSQRRCIDDLTSAEAGGSGDAARKTRPMSTFMALAALGWTAFVRSKGLGAGDDAYLMFLADLRTCLDQARLKDLGAPV